MYPDQLQKYQKNWTYRLRDSYWLESMYTISDGEKIIAALLYKCKTIRSTCLTWGFGRMEPAKGLATGVYEAGILLFKSYCLRNEQCYLHKKVAFFQQNIKLFLIDSLYEIPIMKICFFIVIQLKLLLWTGPILEFKRSALHV